MCYLLSQTYKQTHMLDPILLRSILHYLFRYQIELNPDKAEPMERFLWFQHKLDDIIENLMNDGLPITRWANIPYLEKEFIYNDKIPPSLAWKREVYCKTKKHIVCFLKPLFFALQCYNLQL